MKKIPRTLLILLFIFWMFPGLVGRDPWKADEPYSFGMTSHIMRTGDITLPTVAGTPFLEKPPLYYVTAAISGWIFSPLLAQHDAVRIVNILWVFLSLLFLGLATREVAGPDAAWTAPVLLAGCTLLQMPVHKLITDVALLTGFSAAIYGLAINRRVPGWGGFWIGTGIGIGFLAKGLFGPGMIAVTALALPVIFRAWRTKEYGRSLVVAAAAASPWLVIWPLALYRRSPEYFVEWFWYQNLGRFLGFARGGHDSHLFHIVNLPWLAWPVLPLALWTLWHFRGQWRTHPAYQLPLASFIVMLTVLCLSASARYLYALPLLLPLTMLAAAGIESMPARAALVIGRTSAVLFSALGLAIWLGWYLRLTGRSFLEESFSLDTVHYDALDTLLVGCSLALTLLWLYGLGKLFRKETPFALAWTSGIVLTWGLIMTLWLPWLEAEASYRDIFDSLHNALSGYRQCVASYGIGESERAMVEYYAGVQVRPLEELAILPCDLLLVGMGRDIIDTASQHRWHIEWSGIRPEDHPKEHYTLYHVTPTRRIDSVKLH